MNPYLILGVLIALGGSFGYATWERGDAEKARAELATFKLQVTQAADKARADAQAQEAKDTATIKLQSTNAILQAKGQAEQAQIELQNYLAKGKASKGTDIGHQCFNVPIPDDLKP